MKVAILGSGGREHALAWKMAQSVGEANVFVIPGNGGTHNNIALDINDFEAIDEFCEQQNIGLVFVGPEAPLVNGIIDYFEHKESTIKVFGPSKEAAQLEGSKIWAKQFMQRHGVATAKCWMPNTIAEAHTIIEAQKGNLVIKYDGLAGGKGVYVCKAVAEAKQALQELVDKYGETVNYLLEEKLNGYEISIIGFTDGKNIQLLQPSQDHKQLLDGDQGPNTGGMGAYCPLPFYSASLHKQLMEQIVQPSLNGFQAEKLNYKGVVYFGLMITPNGPKLLEYNARFGDPETEVLLPSLKSDLLALTLACFDGTLADFDIAFNEGYFVDVVLTSGGYPKSYKKGYIIEGLNADIENVMVFHAGTKRTDTNEVITNGGRILNVVANGKTLNDAIKTAYKAVPNYTFTNVFYRKDIAQRKR